MVALCNTILLKKYCVYSLVRVGAVRLNLIIFNFYLPKIIHNLCAVVVLVFIVQML